MTYLTVCPSTPAVSHHFLIRFEASLSCPVDVGTDVFTTHHTGPSTKAAFDQQLPEVLAPFTAETGSVENFTSDLNVGCGQNILKTSGLLWDLQLIPT